MMIESMTEEDKEIFFQCIGMIAFLANRTNADQRIANTLRDTIDRYFKERNDD